MQSGLALVVCGVVWGGCGFEVSPSSDGAITGDARDGGPDGGPPPIDARVDARVDPPDAPPDAPPLTWTVIDTLSIPCTGQAVTSTQVLQANVTYRLRAAGECIENTVNSSRADAEYLGYNIAASAQDSFGDIDNGLAVNDATPGISKQPRWGSYTSSHIYLVDWLGAGATIQVRYHAENYTNNSGALGLQILALQ